MGGGIKHRPQAVTIKKKESRRSGSIGLIFILHKEIGRHRKRKKLPSGRTIQDQPDLGKQVIDRVGFLDESQHALVDDLLGFPVLTVPGREQHPDMGIDHEDPLAAPKLPVILSFAADGFRPAADRQIYPEDRYFLRNSPRSSTSACLDLRVSFIAFPFLESGR